MEFSYAKYSHVFYTWHINLSKITSMSLPLQNYMP